MSRIPDPGFDPRIADWLEADPSVAPRDLMTVVESALPSIPQRRAWRLPWRSQPMNRFAILAATVALAAVAGLGVMAVGSQPSTPPPVPTTAPSSAPTPPPTANARALDGYLVFEHFGKAPDGSSTEMDYDSRMIWIVRPDGDDLRELAPGNPVDGKVSPDISPDGTTVVFSSWSPLRRIYEVTLPTGEPRLLSTDCSGVDEECWDEDPAYSPDGSRIAFVRTRGALAEGQSEIAIQDLATGAVTLLVATGVPMAEGWIAQPSWSPDGTQIVYHRNMQTQADNRPTATSLLIAEADGTAVRELPTPPGQNAADADWSPDGTRILFASAGFRETEGVEVPSDIFTIRPDGTGLVELLPGWAPSWTPDGRHILYWGVRTPYLANADGTDGRAIDAVALDYFGDNLGYGYSWHLQPTP
jgi:Tol biopolymer transport system component